MVAANRPAAMSEALWIVLLTVAGSIGTSLITQWFGRRKAGADATRTLTETALSLIQPLEARIALLEKNLAERDGRIAKLQKDVAARDERIEVLEEKVAALEKERDDLKAENAGLRGAAR